MKGCAVVVLVGMRTAGPMHHTPLSVFSVLFSFDFACVHLQVQVKSTASSSWRAQSPAWQEQGFENETQQQLDATTGGFH